MSSFADDHIDVVAAVEVVIQRVRASA